MKVSVILLVFNKSNIKTNTAVWDNILLSMEMSLV